MQPLDVLALERFLHQVHCLLQRLHTGGNHRVFLLIGLHRHADDGPDRLRRVGEFPLPVGGKGHVLLVVQLRLLGETAAVITDLFKVTDRMHDLGSQSIVGGADVLSGDFQ